MNAATRSGATVAFGNPGNAVGAPDSDSASTTGAGVAGKTGLLRATGFDLGAPVWDGATPKKVRLAVFAGVTPMDGLSFDFVDDHVFLTKAGVQIGTNQATNTPLIRGGGWRSYDIDLTGLGLTPADFNSMQVGANVGFTCAEDAYVAGDFDVDVIYEGEAYRSKPTQVDVDAWGSAGANTNVTVTETTEVSGSVVARQTGNVTVRATYTGVGSAPSHVFLSVYSKARATTDNPFQRTAVADNGLRNASTMTAGQNEAVSEGTTLVKVPVVAGIAEFTLSPSSSASRTFASSEYTDTPSATASVEVTATAAAAPTASVFVSGFSLIASWTGGAYTPPVEEEPLPYGGPLRDDVDFSKGWQDGNEPFGWKEGMGSNFPVPTEPPIEDPYNGPLREDVEFSRGWQDGNDPYGWKYGFGDNYGCGCEDAAEPGTSCTAFKEGRQAFQTPDSLAKPWTAPSNALSLDTSSVARIGVYDTAVPDLPAVLGVGRFNLSTVPTDAALTAVRVQVRVRRVPEATPCDVVFSEALVEFGGQQWEGVSKEIGDEWELRTYEIPVAGLSASDVAAGILSTRIAFAVGNRQRLLSVSKRLSLTPAMEGWNGTGVTVNTGDKFTVTALGHGTWNGSSVAYPEGSYWGTATNAPENPGGVNWTFPSTGTPGLCSGIVVPPFALAVAVEAAQPAFNYASAFRPNRGPTEITAPRNGQVWIGFNDRDDAYGDNTGGFDVTISKKLPINGASLEVDVVRVQVCFQGEPVAGVPDEPESGGGEGPMPGEFL